MAEYVSFPSSLKVVIDVSAAPFGRGVSRYTTNLVTALSAQPDVSLTLWGYSWSQFGWLQHWGSEFGSRVQSRWWQVPPRVMEVAMRWLPEIVWRTGFDPEAVLHAWEWQLPQTVRMPVVVTIHDLAFKMFPEAAHPPIVRRLERTLDWLETHRSAQVIAVSEATRNDILNLTAIDPERVHVVPEALTQESQYQPDETTIAKCRQRLQLPDQFLLFVGTPEPRKNVQRIVAAWQQLRAEFPELGLVIAGGASWDEVEPAEGLLRLGYVSDHDLACLYELASVFVFPSLYEGFGLPILEAYFHDCPVVTSKVSSLPQVAGKAAELVDPYDAAQIADGCRVILSENASARSSRRKQMRTQLQTFSWETAAQQTFEVYRTAWREYHEQETHV